MHHLEREKFCGLVIDVLTKYAKPPSAGDLEAWWGACRTLELGDVERALSEHCDHPDEGKRAPRPIDVIRRVRSGSSSQASTCAAKDPLAGACRYPGIFSDGTTGGEHWYCPWHREDRVGEAAAKFIEMSHSTPYAKAAAKRVARLQEAATHSPSVLNTAHAIALRHGDRPWQGHQFGAAVANPDTEEAA